MRLAGQHQNGSEPALVNIVVSFLQAVQETLTLLRTIPPKL